MIPKTSARLLRQVRRKVGVVHADVAIEAFTQPHAARFEEATGVGLAPVSPTKPVVG